MRLRAAKWWKLFLFFVVSTAADNTYLMDKSQARNGEKVMSHFTFRRKLVHQVLEVKATESTSKNTSSASIRRPHRKPGRQHLPVRTRVSAKSNRALARQCDCCAKLHKRRRQTSIECQAGDVGLCVECWVHYHE